jgi:hypothetical protein
MPVVATDNMRGADVEFGTFSVDPASIAAFAQGTVAVTVTGARTGDIVFVSPQTLTAKLLAVGATVTASDQVTVRLQNVDGGAAVDGASTTWNYVLIRETIAA